MPASAVAFPSGRQVDEWPQLAAVDGDVKVVHASLRRGARIGARRRAGETAFLIAMPARTELSPLAFHPMPDPAGRRASAQESIP